MTVVDKTICKIVLPLISKEQNCRNATVINTVGFVSLQAPFFDGYTLTEYASGQWGRESIQAGQICPSYKTRLTVLLTKRFAKSFYGFTQPVC